MKRKFYVDYRDKSDDLCHIWLMARDKEDAIEEAYHEYWDIKTILDAWEA